MIPVGKLARLAPRHRMRKCALVLGQVERELLARPEAADGALGAYAASIGALLAGARDGAPEAAAEARALASAEGEGLLRAVDALRHRLLAATGQAPADWDLIDPRTGLPDPASRAFRPGLKAYLEDLRSPFNVGSVFRTADAFGIEELLLSHSTADPRHPRALRSAMGAVELVPWRRLRLEELAGELPLIGLELGGASIEDFEFPDRGIAILGSEELGLSQEARELCTGGIVSIPMQGVKGSLNVAVAFGILMYAWTASLRPGS